MSVPNATEYLAVFGLVCTSVFGIFGSEPTPEEEISDKQTIVLILHSKLTNSNSYLRRCLILYDDSSISKAAAGRCNRDVPGSGHCAAKSQSQGAW